MTQGRPFQLIFQFALPLLAGNLLQQTYNMIDSSIVGQSLGTKALAGVGASSSVQFLVLGFCIGICNGFSIPISQKFGAGDYEGMRKYIFHALFLTAVAAVIITTVTAVLCPQILYLLSTPDDIFDRAYRYLLILFLGIPFTLLYNLLSGILRAVGDSRTPFLFLAFSTVLNVILDLVCILILKWDVAGAAIATIAAQAVSGILCLFYIVKKVQILHVSKKHCRVKKNAVSTMLTMGLPMGLQFSITAIGSMVMQSANNGLGSIYVSGFTAGMRIKQFTICPFDAIATAVSVFCGQNLGAGKVDRIKKGIKEGIAMGVLYGAAAGLVMILFGRPLSLLFVHASETAVLDASAKYLRCMGYFFWVLGILNICRMSTQGLGFSGRAVFSGVMEMIARIFVSVVFVRILGFGFQAICFADQTAWVAASCYIAPTCYHCVKKISQKYGYCSEPSRFTQKV